MKFRPGKLAAVAAPEFDLRRTVECGQVFHAMPAAGGWQILAGRVPFYAEQKNGVLRVSAGREALARRYFSLDHPLEAIYAAFPADPFSQSALASCRGLRIIRQPLWECAATFITSTMKQVAHIRQISLQLRGRFGDPIAGSLVNAYPTPAQLAALTEQDLRDCRLGFRARNLLGAARAVASGAVDLEALASLSTSEAREELRRLPGVGRKVANCVLLFACERLDAVPVDVWIARVLRGLRRRKATLLELENFSRRRFGAYAGYIQQYWFHHARMTKTLPA